MFYGITDLTTFIVGTIVIVLLPGPNSLYVMTVTSRHGVAAGFKGAAGIFLGDLILMTLAATGAAELLTDNPRLFSVVKYAGAGYLAWIGAGLVRSSAARWRGESAVMTGEAQDARPHPFRVALVISLMNPKAIFFYISFFIQFVSPGYRYPGLSFLILGVIVQVCSMVYLAALILGGSRLAEVFRQRPRLTGLSLALMGAVFIGFGARLAWSSLG